MMGELGVIGEVIEHCLNNVEQNKLKRTHQRHELKTEQREAWRLLGVTQEEFGFLRDAELIAFTSTVRVSSFKLVICTLLTSSMRNHSWKIGRSNDVRRWNRDSLLTPYQSFGWQWLRNDKTVASIRVHTEPEHIVLTYRHQSSGNDWTDESYSVRLEWTSCNYGGKRPWFLCPASGCGRRVAILYGGAIFACRHCHQLTYPSQREADYNRAARRADKIRERLGWEQGIFNPKGWKKPKGMHWDTFERLNIEHDAFVSESLSGIASEFGWFKNPILGDD